MKVKALTPACGGDGGFLRRKRKTPHPPPAAGVGAFCAGRTRRLIPACGGGGGFLRRKDKTPHPRLRRG